MHSNRDSGGVDENRLRQIIREELHDMFHGSEPEQSSGGHLPDPLVNKVRFRNRRRMAWLSFFSMIAATMLIFFYVPAQNVNHYEVIIAWFYGTLSSIIITYMGVTILPYFGKGGGQSAPHYGNNPYQPRPRLNPINTMTNQNRQGGAYDDER